MATARNLRPPASQPGAQPSEPPVRGDEYKLKGILSFRAIMQT